MIAFTKNGQMEFSGRKLIKKSCMIKIFKTLSNVTDKTENMQAQMNVLLGDNKMLGEELSYLCAEAIGCSLRYQICLNNNNNNKPNYMHRH